MHHVFYFTESKSQTVEMETFLVNSRNGFIMPHAACDDYKPVSPQVSGKRKSSGRKGYKLLCGSHH